MRRLCFDTESNRFVSLVHGVVDPGSRFDCGVVYDEENNKYLEFSFLGVCLLLLLGYATLKR
jgi:hypothetical protein